jgi:hypothetical protein
VLVFATAFVRAGHREAIDAGADERDETVLGIDGEAIPASVS